MRPSFWKTIKVSSIVFWCHWLVALTGHLLAVTMPIGLFRLLWIQEIIDPWVKLFLLGVFYMGLLYTVNHVTHSDGFCILTDLENFYREKEGLLPASKRFVPRFYRKNRELWRYLKAHLKL